MVVVDKRQTSSVLAAELATYEAQRDELLQVAEEKFVLIKNKEVAGIFESQLDAINQGYRQYGNVPFLTKQICRFERPLTFVSGHLAF